MMHSLSLAASVTTDAMTGLFFAAIAHRHSKPYWKNVYALGGAVLSGLYFVRAGLSLGGW